MIFKYLEKNDYIICIYICKFLIKLQKSVNLLLSIYKKIFISYNYNISKILTLIYNYSKFISMV